MINLNNSKINDWAEWIAEGKTVKYNTHTQKFEQASLWGRFCLFFRPSLKREIDQKLTSLVLNELRSRFQDGQRGRQLEELILLADALKKSKRIQKHAPGESAILERYSVGMKRAFLKREANYTLLENIKFYHPDASQRDERLLGVTQEFAEKNPDFVEFALNNHLYHQMVRTFDEKSTCLEIVDGEPMLPFVRAKRDGFAELYAFDENKDLENCEKRSWSETKAYLKNHSLIKPESSVLKWHHMTKWGLLQQHSYLWDSMIPITKINPPSAACFQVVSYHSKEKLVPGLFEDQGHSGMVFVDKNGYVYSCGFFCHPKANFYAALKAQPAVIRSPDLYEARVDLSWQSIVSKKAKGENPSSMVRWNDGILQFDLVDDEAGKPCLAKILQAWSKAQDGIFESPEKLAIANKVKQIEVLLGANSKISKIEQSANELFAMLSDLGLVVEAMSAEQKFAALMGRMHDLQRKTVDALSSGDWEQGALTYMMAENNCTHVSRYYFGQYGEVMLGLQKTANIVNTRPSQEGPFLPRVEESPISRLKWIEISLKTVLLGRVLRLLSLTPIVATKYLGRGESHPGIRAKTSTGSALKNLFKTHVAPQQVREEGMAQQFLIPSRIHKFLGGLFRPSWELPIYH